tara:strand:+ start:188 stop:664 length:477 start_codon:yes stop_codon:yes gene_type:complete
MSGFNVDLSATLGNIVDVVVDRGTNAAVDFIIDKTFGDDDTDAERIGREKARQAQRAADTTESFAKAIDAIVQDDDLSDIKLGSTGFLTDQVDYRQVSAPAIQPDRGLQSIIQSLLSSPPVTPEIGLNISQALGPSRLPSIRSARQSRRLSKYVKGLG